MGIARALTGLVDALYCRAVWALLARLGLVNKETKR